MSEALLAAVAVEKRFGGVQALRGVDFELRAGEVHALLGENGAGKSTLMNVLAGVHASDAGHVALAGKEVRFANPREAQAAGIATIFQELDLVPGLDVAANLFLGNERTRAGVLLDDTGMRRRATERLATIGPDIDVTRRVSELSIGQRQIVSIAKALAQSPRVLIMDEPTAALTVGETGRLFEIVRRLAADGVGVIYISHRLEEVPMIADRVTVLRDGEVAGVAEPDAPQAVLVRLLVGRPLEELYPERREAPGRLLLRLVRARYRTVRAAAGWQAPEMVSLDVCAGEIVGLAGLTGAGRSELLGALYGAAPEGRWEGELEIDDRPARLGDIAAARRAGIAFVGDDRRSQGLALGMSVGRNLVMSVMRRITPFGFVSPPRERRAIDEALGQFDIRPRDPGTTAGALSGGNQQKVVLAKAILSEPRLLLLDEPTRGVDVGAKAEIYRRLRELAARGLGILVASSEMPELIGLCDRIVVMRKGRDVAMLPGGTDEHRILEAANGMRVDG